MQMSRSRDCAAGADHAALVPNVVSMADYPRAATRIRRDGPDCDRGVLLLFTGVRYERQIEPADPVAEGERRRRRR